jgi:cobalt-zinc-cadmium efflux system membrane fusion protein
MEIVNTEHIHLELIVFEKDVSRIRKGQGIRFRIPELSAQVHEGSVYLIGGIVDENRTVTVHGHVDEESLDQLMVGMFVQADILIPPDSRDDSDIPWQWALPETAFDITEEGAYILLLEATTDEGYTFRRVPVQEGAVSEGYMVLSAPRSFGEADRILVRGAEMLSPQ